MESQRTVIKTTNSMQQDLNVSACFVIGICGTVNIENPFQPSRSVRYL
jgi:hypothetical protein